MQPLGQHRIIIAATVLTFITSPQPSIRRETLSLPLCSPQRIPLRSRSPARANYYGQSPDRTRHPRVHLPCRQQGCNALQQVALGASWQTANTPLAVGSGKGHGPTRGPRDAAKGEECGWVNDQLGNGSSHKDSQPPRVLQGGCVKSS